MEKIRSFNEPQKAQLIAWRISPNWSDQTRATSGQQSI